MAHINESHIEFADINFFTKDLGYQHIDACEKKLIGRETLKDVVLADRLQRSLENLNSHIPQDCIRHAMFELTKSRATLTPVLAKKEIYELVKNGVPVTYKNELGREENDYVRVIDFNDKTNNDFLVVSQLSIEYQEIQNITRRPDLLLYINGLPLVMIELKNATEKV